MVKDNDWFEVHQSRPYLYTIREKLADIDSRFYTEYTNLYLIVGSESAVLFDTGSGVGNLSGVVDELLDGQDLMVINSHNHFDHVGSNYQFDETHIHRMDFKKLMRPMSLDFLHGCNPDFESYFDDLGWKMRFAADNIPLIGNELIDLGEIELQLHYTPGHTPGSICMISDRGEIYTGDTLHYGAVYLPSEDQLPFYLSSLEELGDLIDQNHSPRIFPGHEAYDVDQDLFAKFMRSYEDSVDIRGKYDPFLEAFVKRMDEFIFITPTQY